MEKTTSLDALLEQAEARTRGKGRDQASRDENERGEFEAADVYAAHSAELIDLVKPLQQLLPDVLEYKEYAAPRKGRAEGTHYHGEDALIARPAEAVLRTKNPVSVFSTAAIRANLFPEMPDPLYNLELDYANHLIEWWERRPSVNALELAKSAIVQTVLADDNLREQVLSTVRNDIEESVAFSTILAMWKD